MNKFVKRGGKNMLPNKSYQIIDCSVDEMTLIAGSSNGCHCVCDYLDQMKLDLGCARSSTQCQAMCIAFDYIGDACNEQCSYESLRE
jgi:hypothetical protein